MKKKNILMFIALVVNVTIIHACLIYGTTALLSLLAPPGITRETAWLGVLTLVGLVVIGAIISERKQTKDAQLQKRNLAK